MWQAWRASASPAEAFNTSFSPEPPASSCLLRKSQTKLLLLHFPLFHTKAAHEGSHHPLVTADSSHCELGDCPAQETTSLRWEGAECGHGVSRGSPTPVSPRPPTHGSARVSPWRLFSSCPSCHPKSHHPPGWALCVTLASQGLGMQLWWKGGLRIPFLLPQRHQLCVPKLGAVMSPKVPVLLCRKLRCVHGLQKLRMLDGRCEAAWKP